MTDCYCDYDPPEFWRSETRRARKTYRCAECGGSILPKDTHEYVSGKWDGFLDTFRTCERCVAIRDWVKGNVPCFCWAHGNMIDDARDTIEDAYRRARDEVTGLRFGFLRRIVARDKFNRERVAVTRSQDQTTDLT